MVRDAEVDQARLFDAGDDLDGMAERLFGLREKRVGVARATQRVRADDAHLVRAHVAQPLAKAAQAGERALLARSSRSPSIVEAGGQADHLAQPIDDRRLAVLIARDDHVEAVGAKIDRGHDLGRLVAGPRLRVGHHHGP